MIFEIDIDEAEFKFGRERHHGRIVGEAGECLYQWDMALTAQPSESNIQGGLVDELAVWKPGHDLMSYKGGQWTVAPAGDMAQAVLNKLLTWAA